MKDKEFRMSAKTLILPLFLILLCCVFGCRNKHHTEKNETAHDLPQIKDSGELVVLTLYSSTSYFIYRGQEMGFQYELSEQFAKSLGLKLRIEVARNVRELIQKLQSGEGDMIAYNLPITKEWKDSLLYCGEDIITHQVIVQQGNGKHKPLKDGVKAVILSNHIISIYFDKEGVILKWAQTGNKKEFDTPFHYSMYRDILYNTTLIPSFFISSL